MNERITQLAEQAMEEIPCLPYWDNGYLFVSRKVLNQEKFAELIIQECIQQTYPDDFKVDGIVPHNLPDAVSRIKEHFGLSG